MNFNRILFLSLLILPLRGFSQFAPVSTAGTVSVYTSVASVPVSVKDFNNIANCLLELHYDTAVALATGATANPLIGGGLFVNLNTPGVIILSWFTWPGVNLPDNSVLFQLNFTRSSIGTTAIEWYNEGITCIWGDGNSVELIDVPTENFYFNGNLTFKSPDAPHVILPVIESCASDIIEVPVKVTDFNEIGTLHLTMWFENGKLLYHSWVNTSAFPNLSLVQISPGVMDISGFTGSTGQGITLNDSAVLFTVKFYNTGGDATLQWYDDGGSCQFTGPSPELFILNDVPGTLYYLDGGSVTIPLPGPAGPVQGPAGGNVCAGETGIGFSVQPVISALHYNWNFPPGFVIVSGAGTNQVIVDAGPGAVGGEVTVNGQNGCGSGSISEPLAIFVNESPAILNQPVSAGPIVAGVGSASFLVDAVGSELSFQWQEYSNVWVDLSEGGFYSGTQTPELTVQYPMYAMNGRHYRCSVLGLCTDGLLTDGNAQLIVSPPVGISGYNQEIVTPIVFPNPLMSHSQLSVGLKAKGDLALSLFSPDGTMITKWDYLSCSEGRNIFKLDPGILFPGVYILKVEIRGRDEYRCYPIKCLVTNDFR